MVRLEELVSVGTVEEEAVVDPSFGRALPKTMNTPEGILQLDLEMKCQIYEPSNFSTVSGDQMYRLCGAIGARYTEREVDCLKEKSTSERLGIP